MAHQHHQHRHSLISRLRLLIITSQNVKIVQVHFVKVSLLVKTLFNALFVLPRIPDTEVDIDSDCVSKMAATPTPTTSAAPTAPAPASQATHVVPGQAAFPWTEASAAPTADTVSPAAPVQSTRAIGSVASTSRARKLNMVTEVPLLRVRTVRRRQR